MMRSTILTLALAAAVLLAVAPRVEAAEWISVAKSDHVEVFVKAGSLSRDGDRVSARAKENYVAPQPAAKKGKTYLSVRNDYRIDCAQRRVAYRETKAYSETDLGGEVVQKASRSEKNLVWMDAPAGTVFGELLDYACSSAPGAPPPT